MGARPKRPRTFQKKRKHDRGYSTSVALRGGDKGKSVALRPSGGCAGALKDIGGSRTGTKRKMGNTSRGDCEIYKKIGKSKKVGREKWGENSL